MSEIMVGDPFHSHFLCSVIHRLLALVNHHDRIVWMSLGPFCLNALQQRFHLGNHWNRASLAILGYADPDLPIGEVQIIPEYVCRLCFAETSIGEKTNQIGAITRAPCSGSRN